nr:gp120=envelope protein {V3 region, principal neutralization domain} [human immunodeficiency virus type 1 HIV-1, HB26V3N, patient 5 isolate, Peptide Partial, 18 aa] [Human immunodeficiency virus 1]
INCTRPNNTRKRMTMGPG